MTDPWDLADSPSRTWAAGDWSIDMRGAELADVSFRGHRVLRSIRAIVRDRDWNTAAWIVDEGSETGDGLALSVRSEGFGSHLRGRIIVEATGDRLSVVFDAVSRTAFETSRTGLVVLHPPQLAGVELAVGHTDGSSTRTAFPKAISPHQPACDIAALAWQQDGVDVDVRFAGDAFEMEDQRNWTDASFKTYSRPLALPTPYVLEAGERVTQSVTVTVTDAPPGEPPGHDDGSSTDDIVLAAAGPFPEISIAASTEPGERPPIDAVGSSLLVELDLARPGWRNALERAARVGLPLDVRIVPDPDAADSLDRVATALSGVSVVRVGAFAATGPAAHVSDAETVDALRASLAKVGVDAPIIGGVRSHFTELNREHARLPEGLDAVTFSTTPLFHSLDNPQLVEAVAMQRLVALQAVEIASGSPVYIGPVTLRPRFNNVATAGSGSEGGEEPDADCDTDLAGPNDPRQASPALAAWTIASAAALAVTGVRGLCFFEEWGPRGIRDSAGDRFPVSAAVEALAALAAEGRMVGARLLGGDSPDGLVWALGASTDTTTRVLVTNLDERDRHIRVTHPAGVLTVIVPPRAFVARVA